MTNDEKLELAMELLERAAEDMEDGSPDPSWLRDYYVLTGEHMILTDEGWEPGDIKPELIAEYGHDAIYDEVNVPDGDQEDDE